MNFLTFLLLHNDQRIVCWRLRTTSNFVLTGWYTKKFEKIEKMSFLKILYGRHPNTVFENPKENCTQARTHIVPKSIWPKDFGKTSVLPKLDMKLNSSFNFFQMYSGPESQVHRRHQFADNLFNIFRFFMICTIFKCKERYNFAFWSASDTLFARTFSFLCVFLGIIVVFRTFLTKNRRRIMITWNKHVKNLKKHFVGKICIIFLSSLVHVFKVFSPVCTERPAYVYDCMLYNAKTQSKTMSGTHWQLYGSWNRDPKGAPDSL